MNRRRRHNRDLGRLTAAGINNNTNNIDININKRDDRGNVQGEPEGVMMMQNLRAGPRDRWVTRNLPFLLAEPDARTREQKILTAASPKVWDGTLALGASSSIATGEAFSLARSGRESCLGFRDNGGIYHIGLRLNCPLSVNIVMTVL